METIKITSKQAKPIVNITFPDYKGRKFSVKFSPTVTFYDTNWSGGTCNKYAFVRSDGKMATFAPPAPWMNPIEGATVDLPDDVLVVEHSYFCGQDCGITIYANPVNLPKWLPAPQA